MIFMLMKRVNENSVDCRSAIEVKYGFQWISFRGVEMQMMNIECADVSVRNVVKSAKT